MKKILLTVVLGVACVAVAQNTTQPAQGQPATRRQRRDNRRAAPARRLRRR